MNLRSEGDPMRAPKRRTPAPIAEWTREEEERTSTPVTATATRPVVLPGDVLASVRRAFVGTATQRERTVATLSRAVEAYDRHRYEEAARLARQVVDVVPTVPAVRELAGLAAYRCHKWAAARTNLRVHADTTGDPQHLPLVMDCDRAQRRFPAVARTFDELTAATPPADVLAEGRIVMAAALADEGRHRESVDLLQRAGAARNLRNPAFRHIRMWYALADAYDRAGDPSSARDLFARVVQADPEAYDARDRLDELGVAPTRRARPSARAPRAPR